MSSTEDQVTWVKRDKAMQTLKSRTAAADQRVASSLQRTQFCPVPLLHQEDSDYLWKQQPSSQIGQTGQLGFRESVIKLQK